jgi:hypothetical protein
MQGQIYAKGVADEILAVIAERREMGDDDAQILEAVEDKAKDIRDTASAGYY